MIDRNSCSIVVPIYKPELAADEEVSMSSIRRHLSGHGICLVAPESLDLSSVLKVGETTERFPDEFFSGITGYNRLLTSSEFYERFAEYSHILVTQLDCLVFRDELSDWMRAGYDYIAAPWFMEFLEKPERGLWRVGNGGFSLRNVQSFLRILRKKVPKASLYPQCGSNPWEPTLPKQDAGRYRWRTLRNRLLNPLVELVCIEQEARGYRHHEDLFWSLEAGKIDGSFRVASAEEALPFAFEMAPRWCFEKNKRELPFGCHAWARYDRAFWEERLSDLDNDSPAEAQGRRDS
jgi:hypothetical protein